VSYIISKATKDDIVEIYNLLHRKFIQKYSSNSEKYEWEKHKKWYEFLIRSPYYEIYVIKDNSNKVIGQLKFEIDGEIATLNIFIEEDKRGVGLGKKLLEESTKLLKLEKKEIKLIVSYILEENDISQSLFENLGYVYGGKKNYNGIEHLIYTNEI
jgi:L-amino acid N-acyltransferase YncA